MLPLLNYLRSTSASHARVSLNRFVVGRSRNVVACGLPVQRSSSFGSGPGFAETTQEYDELDAFEQIVMSRKSGERLDNRPLPMDLLRRIFRLTLRSPSSFNLTPYTLIAVTDNPSKALVAEAMIGPGNRARVLSAPLTLIFAADLEAHRRIDATFAMERAAGAPTGLLRALDVDARLMTGGTAVGGLFQSQRGSSNSTSDSSASPSSSSSSSTTSFPQGVASSLRASSSTASSAFSSPLSFIAQTLLSVTSRHIAPMPSFEDPRAWAYKNAAFAAQTFMLAATAAGLGTHPMEGFDARRMLEAIEAPLSGMEDAAGMSSAAPLQTSAAAKMEADSPSSSSPTSPPSPSQSPNDRANLRDGGEERSTREGSSRNDTGSNSARAVPSTTSSCTGIRNFRYGIPIVITAGYRVGTTSLSKTSAATATITASSAAAAASGKRPISSPRPSLSQVVKLNSFRVPFPEN